jgi:TfoX N-terminal domain
MPTASIEYEKLLAAYAAIEGVTSGQMFGKACLKVNGKAFAALHQEILAFKLTGELHKKALSLKGAVLWDPSGKGRPMKEWVALPATESKHFKALAADALAYVQTSQ